MIALVKNGPEIPFRKDWSFEPGEDIAIWDGPQLVAVLHSDQPQPARNHPI